MRELAEAARDLPLVVVGDGPLRTLFPQAVGFVPPREVGAFYERAAVVVVPSRREGYGVTAREAMAYGRPVVATRVGGLVDAVEDGVTGLLVPPGDVVALRRALEELLADGTRRTSPGSARHARLRRRPSGARQPSTRSGPCTGTRCGQSTRQRRSVRSTRSPSSVVSFLPSSRERALYVIGTS